MAVGFPTKTSFITGDVLQASEMNDLAGTVNLLTSAYESAAGVNKIINGDFGINQRGFTSTTTTGTYGFDRFAIANADGTVTYSAQTFTLGAAPVAGYEGTNFAQIVTTGQTLTTATAALVQRIESVKTLAGQTATVSFYAKANTGTPNVAVNIVQNFGTGGSPSAAVTTTGTAQAITTSWARYSFTIAIPSISGKTLGTSADYLNCQIYVSGGSTSAAPTVGIQSNTFQIWGVQVEAGPSLSDFKTATGTKQGELAECQRYFYQVTSSTALFTTFGTGYVATGTVTLSAQIFFPVTMRTSPTLTASAAALFRALISGAAPALTAIASTNIYPQSARIDGTTTGLTTGYGGEIQSNNSLAASLAFSAEL